MYIFLKVVKKSLFSEEQICSVWKLLLSCRSANIDLLTEIEITKASAVVYWLFKKQQVEYF